MSKTSLTSRTLRVAAMRIGLVSVLAGVVSYFVNENTIESAIRKQLVLSTEQTLQREALPFREIADVERNFLDEFAALDRDGARRPSLIADFDAVFVRHADGSYTQRPGIYEGEPLADGRRFPKMSATYAPDHPPTDDVKARFMMSFLLSYKYGSSLDGRLFNIYGVVPEKGFPIHQDADIGKAFTYSGPEALELEDYEFYTRGLAAQDSAPFFTKMYWDYSNNAWMTTVATPDRPDAKGRHRILACVDVLLDDLMRRVARPAFEGAYSSIFIADAQGTLIYHKDHLDDLKASEGSASIRSLGIDRNVPILDAARTLAPGTVRIVETSGEIVALGLLPETPWVVSIHYPKALMRPAIYQNLAIVVALGVLTLLVEIFILRSVLFHQVARPLQRLIGATRLVGVSEREAGGTALPLDAQDEIGELAKSFHEMSRRVAVVQRDLEATVQERTAALEQANRKLRSQSLTDELTGVANRRRFVDALEWHWHQARDAGAWLMVAMIDVDCFKAYNDRYGHLAGDACLRRIAGLIDGELQGCGALFARYGGEEFAAILTDVDPGTVPDLAARLCAVIADAAIPHTGSPFGRVTVSLGVCVRVPDGGGPAEALLRSADDALYRSKELGRNRATVV